MPCDHSAAGCLHARRRRRQLEGCDYWLTRKGAHHDFSVRNGEAIALSVRHAALQCILHADLQETQGAGLSGCRETILEITWDRLESLDWDILLNQIIQINIRKDLREFHGIFQTVVTKNQYQCVGKSTKWLVYPAQTLIPAKVHHHASIHSQKHTKKENCCWTCFRGWMSDAPNFSLCPMKIDSLCSKTAQFYFSLWNKYLVTSRISPSWIFLISCSVSSTWGSTTGLQPGPRAASALPGWFGPLSRKGVSGKRSGRFRMTQDDSAFWNGRMTQHFGMAATLPLIPPASGPQRTARYK